MVSWLNVAGGLSMIEPHLKEVDHTRTGSRVGNDCPANCGYTLHTQRERANCGARAVTNDLTNMKSLRQLGQL